MPKKPDLVRRGDLEITQEIINYRNSLSQVFEKLQNLQDQIDDLKSKQHYDDKALHSKLTDHSINHGQEKEKNESLHQSSNSKINDINESICNIHEYLEDFDKSIAELNRQRAESYIKINTLIGEWKLLKDFADINIEGMKNRVEDQTALFRKELEKTKQDLLNIPCKIQPVKDELLAYINSHKIDVETVLKEIHLFKKDKFITEKKMEAIFTEIANLKGKK